MDKDLMENFREDNSIAQEISEGSIPLYEAQEAEVDVVANKKDLKRVVKTLDKLKDKVDGYSSTLVMAMLTTADAILHNRSPSAKQALKLVINQLSDIQLESGRSRKGNLCEKVIGSSTWGDVGVAIGATDEGIYMIKMDTERKSFSMSAYTLAPVTEEQLKEWELDSVEDTIGMLDSGFLQYHIDEEKAENWFREAYAEMDISYAEDIKSEDSSEGYANRLVDEMVERSIISKEQASKEGFDGSDFQGDFVEQMVDEKISEGLGGYKYYEDNFGEEEASAIALQQNMFDEDSIAEEMVRSKIDGMSGHFDWEFSGSEEYYLDMISAGQDQFDSIDKPLIKKAEFDVLKEAWDTLHLKDIEGMSEDEKELMDKAVKIYDGYMKKKETHLEKAIQYFMLKAQKGDKYQKSFNKILKKKGYKTEGVIRGIAESKMVSGFGMELPKQDDEEEVKEAVIVDEPLEPHDPQMAEEAKKLKEDAEDKRANELLTIFVKKKDADDASKNGSKEINIKGISFTYGNRELSAHDSKDGKIYTWDVNNVSGRGNEFSLFDVIKESKKSEVNSQLDEMMETVDSINLTKVKIVENKFLK